MKTTHAILAMIVAAVVAAPTLGCDAILGPLPECGCCGDPSSKRTCDQGLECRPAAFQSGPCSKRCFRAGQSSCEQKR